jgi:DNA-binding LacI/PurR family transcriptional regulator
VSTKHGSVRDALETAIRDGEFIAGEQLPSEHELAERFGVSYMTARKAVSDLVAADLLERRGRKGTFVRAQTRDKLSRPTLNLITSAYEGWGQRAFLSFGMQTAEKQGWNSNIIRLTPGQQDPAVRAIDRGELAVILLDDIRPASSLGLAMRAARGKAVVLHRKLSDSKIPSILNEWAEYVGMAIDHLRNTGHHEIALICQVEPGTEHADDVEGRLAKTGGYDIGLINVPTPLFYSPTRPAYEAVTAYLKGHPNTTGLVSTGEEITVGTLAACREIGRSIPDHVSLVNLGNAPMLEFITPPVTCIDNNLHRQLDIAVDILKTAAAGQPIAQLLHYTPVDLVERESVRPR